MTTEQIFSTLGIGITRSENEIRDAYRRELPKHHPEEDAAGFRTLREAYEEALAYARRPEESEDGAVVTAGELWDPRSPLGVFMGKLIDLYTHYDRRIQTEAWEALLADPAVTDFDEEEQLRREVFRYLADHFRLPVPVWGLLDRTFLLRERQRELTEFLPPEFVSFMVGRISAEPESDFPFAALAGYPAEDKRDTVDGFINALYGGLSAFHREAYDEAVEEAAEAAKYGLSHPWYEGLALCLAQRAGEEAEVSRIDALLADRPNDAQVIFCALTFYEKGDYAERMRDLCGRVTAKDSPVTDSVVLQWAHYALGEEAEKREDWEEAFRQFGEAGRQAYTEGVQKKLAETGGRVAELLVEREDLTEKERMLLLLAADRAELPRVGIDYFRRHPEAALDTEEFLFRLASLHNAAGNYEQARELSMQGKEKLWRALAETDEDDPGSGAEVPAEEGASAGDEADDEHSLEKIRDHLAQFRVLDAKAAFNEADDLEKDDPVRAERYEEALTALAEAEELDTEGTGYCAMFRIEILRARRAEGDADRLLEIGEQYLRENGENYFVLAAMQGAYEDKRLGQEVVDLYHRARALYAGDAKIYERAGDVFFAFDQYDDALQVIDAAKEAGAMSDPLRRLRFLAKGMRAKTKAEWLEAYEEAKALIAELKVLADTTVTLPRAGETPEEEALRERVEAALQELGYAHYDLARICADPEVVQNDPPLDDLEASTFNELREAVDCVPDITDAHYRLGVLYTEFPDKLPNADGETKRKWEEEAYRHLKRAADDGLRGVWLYWTLANLCDDRDEDLAAAGYMSWVVDNDEGAKEQIYRVCQWYRIAYEETCIEEYADRALHYGALSEEKCGPKRAVSFSCGLIALRRREFARAVELFTELLARCEDLADEDGGRWYRERAARYRGEAEYYLGRYDEALTDLKQALVYADHPDSYSEYPWICQTICRCYRDTRRVAEGREFFDALIRRLNDTLWGKKFPGRKELRRALPGHIAEIAFVSDDYETAIPYFTEFCYGSLDLSQPAQGRWDWARAFDRMNEITSKVQGFPRAFSFTMEELLDGALSSIAREGEPKALRKTEGGLTKEEAETLAGYANFLRVTATFMNIFLYHLEEADLLLRRALCAGRRAADAHEECFGLDRFERIYDGLIWNAFLRGDRESAAGYAEAMLDYWRRDNHYAERVGLSLEEAVREKPWRYQLVSLFKLCEYCLMQGELARAQEFLAIMEGGKLCQGCDNPACFEHLGAAAWHAYLSGDKERAKVLADRANRASWDRSFNHAVMLQHLMEREEQEELRGG